MRGGVLALAARLGSAPLYPEDGEGLVEEPLLRDRLDSQPEAGAAGEERANVSLGREKRDYDAPLLQDPKAVFEERDRHLYARRPAVHGSVLYRLGGKIRRIEEHDVEHPVSEARGHVC